MYLNIGLCTNHNQSNTDWIVGYRIIKYHIVNCIAQGYENYSYASVHYTSFFC